MTARTALAVCGETRRVPFRTCETVETETPARLATSAMVAIFPPPGFGRRLVILAKLHEAIVCAIVSTRKLPRIDLVNFRASCRPSSSGRGGRIIGINERRCRGALCLEEESDRLREEP